MSGVFRRYVPALLVAAWSLAPALWQVLTALKPDAQITRVPTLYLPDPATTEHFVALWQRKPFGTYLLNSFWIGALATLLSVSLAALAAAGMGRMRARGRDLAPAKARSPLARADGDGADEG